MFFFSFLSTLFLLFHLKGSSEKSKDKTKSASKSDDKGNDTMSVVLNIMNKIKMESVDNSYHNPM